MCLAIPGMVENLIEDQDLKMARVNFGGIRKSICLEYTPEAKVGDYVLVHVGFAISIIDEDEAQRTLAFMTNSNQLELDELTNEARSDSKT